MEHQHTALGFKWYYPHLKELRITIGVAFTRTMATARGVAEGIGGSYLRQLLFGVTSKQLRR